MHACSSVSIFVGDEIQAEQSHFIAKDCQLHRSSLTLTEACAVVGQFGTEQFGTRTIWHQDNLAPDNLAPRQFFTMKVKAYNLAPRRQTDNLAP